MSRFSSGNRVKPKDANGHKTIFNIMKEACIKK